MTKNHDVNSVLHIYNALKSCAMIDGDLPLLSDIDRYFCELKFFGMAGTSQNRENSLTDIALAWAQTMRLLPGNRTRRDVTTKVSSKNPTSKPRLSRSKLAQTRKTSKR